MRKVFRPLGIALCLFATTQQAKALEGDFRAARAAEDRAGRETRLADAHEAALAKPDFAPLRALDLALVLQADTQAEAAMVEPLVAHARAGAPSRHTPAQAQVVLAFNWGGSLKDSIAPCARMAGKVSGCDAEFCLIEMAFANGVDGALRAAAVAALVTRDEGCLDHARLDATSGNGVGVQRLRMKFKGSAAPCSTGAATC